MYIFCFFSIKNLRNEKIAIFAVRFKGDFWVADDMKTVPIGTEKFFWESIRL
jgi:hypothetical protein